MDERTLFDALMNATSTADLEKAVLAYKRALGGAVSEVPFGRRPNNRGAIEVSSDAGRSAIERLTNAHDALLELEHDKHGGIPECRSPRQAASAWLSVPPREGLSGLQIKRGRTSLPPQFLDCNLAKDGSPDFYQWSTEESVFCLTRWRARFLV
jgi:hypothetical protein